ncbi:hypothetical protein Pint_21543 [Pistacia integerrima]|uniref:Uncharacterized protein n=1 Tax=Pistacia integerrima TaxID=434235 RepID=A0ACC0XBW0_9ROSI|nr:hypothetical protein Pint_21543 [Pistacia integerrima]
MQKSLPSTQQKRIVFSVPPPGISGGQDNTGMGNNCCNEKPIDAHSDDSVAGRNGQRGTGNNPSRGVVTTIHDPSAVAAPDQGTPSGTDNNPSRGGVKTIHSSSAVAAPNQRTPRSVNNPQNLTFVPTQEQVNK